MERLCSKSPRLRDRLLLLRWPPPRAYGGSHWYLVIADSGETFEYVDTSTGEVVTFGGIELFAQRWIGGDWEMVQITDFSPVRAEDDGVWLFRLVE